VATDRRPPDADPRHYAIAIVKEASCRARSDLGDLHPQEARHTLRRHQGKGDPGLVVIKEWWSLNDQICEVADRFARAGALTSGLKLWMPNPFGPIA
jgi:hypothetical protein